METRLGKKGSESLVDKVRGISASPEAARQAPLHIQVLDLAELNDLVRGIKDSFDLHKTSVDKQIAELKGQVTELGDRIKTTIKEEVSNATANIQQYIDTEIGRLAQRIDQVEDKIKDIDVGRTVEYDPDVSVIISKVDVRPDEDALQLVNDIIHNGLELPEVPVVRAMRLRQRQDPPDGRQMPLRPQAPPLIKVQFRNVDDKVKVLRRKRRLADKETYRGIMMKSSKPHAERVMEMNFRTLLDILPQGGGYMLTGSGKIVKKTDQ